MAETDDLEQDLRELSRGWAERLAGKLREIEEATRPLLEGNHAPSVTERVHFLLHRLAGSGATFGFPGVTRAAREMERSVKELLDAGRAPREDEMALIGSQLLLVERACAAAASGEPDEPSLAAPAR